MADFNSISQNSARRRSDEVPTLQREITGNCGFCLKPLSTRPEVRRFIRCGHLTCTYCLKETIALFSDVRCPVCRVVYERFNISRAPVVYKRNLFVCTGDLFNSDAEACDNESVSFCILCQQLFCSYHLEVHGKVHEEHEEHQPLYSSIVPIEEYSIVSIKEYKRDMDRYTYRSCGKHRTEDVKKACSTCQKPLCIECVTEKCDDDKAHEVVTLNRVAETVREKLQTDISELRKFDSQLESNLRENLKRGEQLTQIDEDLKTKLFKATEQAIQEIRNTAEQLQKEIDECVRNERSRQEKYELDVNPMKESAGKLLSQARSIMSTHDMDVIKAQPKQSAAMSSTYCIDIPSIPAIPKCTISNLTATIKYPWKFNIVDNTDYNSLEHVADLNSLTPDQQCYTICQLDDERLLHGGNYGLLGLKVDSNIIDDAVLSSIYLDEFADKLFVLCKKSSDWLINEIDPNLSHTRQVIKYPDNGRNIVQHIAVNNLYILTTDTAVKGVKVFGKDDHKHRYDMTLDDFELPLGIDFMNEDSIVVCDGASQLIMNIKISKKPKIIWRLSESDGIRHPTGVHVDRQSERIFVSGDCEIYMISTTGNLMNTLKVPDGKPHVTDISVFNDEVVLAHYEHGIRKFKLQCE